MKTGLCITTYNRPAYLKTTLASLALADLTDVMVVIVDDCSTDPETIKQVYDFAAIKLITAHNSSIRNSLRLGLDYLFLNGCQVVINLDSDVLVKKDFVSRLLALHLRYPNNIITGFNALGKSLRGVARHPVITTGDGYNTKKSVGGINLLLTWQTYTDYVKPALLSTAQNGGQWDKEACRLAVQAGHDVYCTVPSVVQHIGIQSSMGHRDNPDIAEDFIADVYKNKLCVLQPFGLGDIIFTQTLIKALGNYDIVWPVKQHFVEDLNRAYPEIKFIPDHATPVPLTIKKDGLINGHRAIPIRWSDTARRVPYKWVMRAKYDMYGLDWRTWRTAAMWQRNTAKEQELFKLLKLNGQPYTVVNNTFGCDFQGSVQIAGLVKPVQLRQIAGFSLFDWALVLERAAAIHTVSTSILYILDMLKTCPVNVYIRRPTEADHDFYNYIFTDPKFIYR